MRSFDPSRPEGALDERVRALGLPRFEPTRFGPYLLRDRIGSGGMAEIFLAAAPDDADAPRRLVIKRILPTLNDDEQFVRMFIEEAKLCVALDHPNIVQVFDLDEIDHQLYIAMEYVDGRDLLKTLAACGRKRIGFPTDIALYIVMAVLRGLGHAHELCDPNGAHLGIIHRDVSPSNILLSFSGEVKIGDFGIAKATTREKTATGILKGKFGYMAPEQVTGSRIDHRADVFAAGIVLYELLTGHRLFSGKNDLAVLERVRDAVIDPPVRHHRPDLDPALEAIVGRALARRVEDRFQSALELHDALRDYVRRCQAEVGPAHLARFMQGLFLSEPEEQARRARVGLPAVEPSRAPPRTRSALQRPGPPPPSEASTEVWTRPPGPAVVPRSIVTDVPSLPTEAHPSPEEDEGLTTIRSASLAVPSSPTWAASSPGGPDGISPADIVERAIAPSEEEAPPTRAEPRPRGLTEPGVELVEDATLPPMDPASLGAPAGDVTWLEPRAPFTDDAPHDPDATLLEPAELDPADRARLLRASTDSGPEEAEELPTAEVPEPQVEAVRAVLEAREEADPVLSFIDGETFAALDDGLERTASFEGQPDPVVSSIDDEETLGGGLQPDPAEPRDQDVTREPLLPVGLPRRQGVRGGGSLSELGELDELSADGDEDDTRFGELLEADAEPDPDETLAFDESTGSGSMSSPFTSIGELGGEGPSSPFGPPLLDEDEARPDALGVDAATRLGALTRAPSESGPVSGTNGPAWVEGEVEAVVSEARLDLPFLDVGEGDAGHRAVDDPETLLDDDALRPRPGPSTPGRLGAPAGSFEPEPGPSSAADAFDEPTAESPELVSESFELGEGFLDPTPDPARHRPPPPEPTDPGDAEERQRDVLRRAAIRVGPIRERNRARHVEAGTSSLGLPAGAVDVLAEDRDPGFEPSLDLDPAQLEAARTGPRPRVLALLGLIAVLVLSLTAAAWRVGCRGETPPAGAPGVDEAALAPFPEDPAPSSPESPEPASTNGSGGRATPAAGAGTTSAVAELGRAGADRAAAIGADGVETEPDGVALGSFVGDGAGAGRAAADGERSPGPEGERAPASGGEQAVGARGERASEGEQTIGARGEWASEGEQTPGAGGERTPGPGGERADETVADGRRAGANDGRADGELAEGEGAEGRRADGKDTEGEGAVGEPAEGDGSERRRADAHGEGPEREIARRDRTGRRDAAAGSSRAGSRARRPSGGVPSDRIRETSPRSGGAERDGARTRPARREPRDDRRRATRSTSSPRGRRRARSWADEGGRFRLHCPAPTTVRLRGRPSVEAPAGDSEHRLPPGSYVVTIMRGGRVLARRAVRLLAGQAVDLPCP